MGYRDDFYKKRRIIGYTGELHRYPTVYFKSKREYGRITQFHGVRGNIGRNEVRSADNYKIGNAMVKGKIVCVEIDNGRSHESRNRLIRQKEFSPGDLEILAQSIYRCPELKPVASGNRLENRSAKSLGIAGKNAGILIHQEMMQAVQEREDRMVFDRIIADLEDFGAWVDEFLDD